MAQADRRCLLQKLFIVFFIAAVEAERSAVLYAAREKTLGMHQGTPVG